MNTPDKSAGIIIESTIGEAVYDLAAAGETDRLHGRITAICQVWSIVVQQGLVVHVEDQDFIVIESSEQG
jgi:hypothetical protein